MLGTWKDGIENFVVQNEGAITALLICIAVVLILIAVFGKPKHKAAAMIYIVL